MIFICIYFMGRPHKNRRNLFTSRIPDHFLSRIGFNQEPLFKMESGIYKII